MEDRDVLVTLRIKVESLENLLKVMDTRIGKVEDKLEDKYDVVIEKIEKVDDKVDKRETAFWKYLACSILSILATGGIELLINHIPR
jgi:hypothetical protein